MSAHDRSVLQVVQKACDECLYSKNKIVSEERKRRIIAHCDATDTHFVCHKATDAGIDAMCRGHWDRTRNKTLRNRLAQYCGVVRYVALEFLEERTAARRAKRRMPQP